MASVETRERIITTAARLFAQCGYHGVSLRQIAKEAGVQASLAQYHFKNKESVFRSVFERCILPINHDRLGRLDQFATMQAEGQNVTIEDIVRAFVEPTVLVARNRTSSGAYYAELISQITNDPQEHARRISREFTDPIARQTMAAMKAHLPDTDQATLTWCYMFGVGAMIAAVSRTGRVRQLSGGECDPDDAARIVSILVPFIAGGMRAALAVQSKAAVGDPREASDLHSQSPMRKPRSRKVPVRERKAAARKTTASDDN